MGGLKFFHTVTKIITEKIRHRTQSRMFITYTRSFLTTCCGRNGLPSGNT